MRNQTEFAASKASSFLYCHRNDSDMSRENILWKKFRQKEKPLVVLYRVPDRVRPSVLGERTCKAGLRALCTATRALERECV